mmetsp:Transcript_65401/g.171321  ORF Transcript_65401/g.171321 Transcript_65401/m.171321 type:complete len:498 (+) Transcript_65401:848-2341(+)
MLQHPVHAVEVVDVGGVLGRLDDRRVDAVARLALRGVAVPGEAPEVRRVVQRLVLERGVVLLVRRHDHLHGLLGLHEPRDLAVGAVGHLRRVREEVRVVDEALRVQVRQRLHGVHAGVVGAHADDLEVGHGLRDAAVLLRRPVASLHAADDPNVRRTLRREAEGVDHEDLHRPPDVGLPGLADPPVVTWIRHVQGVLVVAVGRVLTVHVGVHAALRDVHVASDAARVRVVHVLLDVDQARALRHLDKGVELRPLHLALLLLPHPAALGHHLQGPRLVAPAQDLRPLRLPLLRLEQLVVLEEVLDFTAKVRRNVFQLRDVVRAALVLEHRDHLLVVPRLVLHVHKPHDAAVGQHAGVQACVGPGLGGRNDEDVQRVAIATERLWHVAVVARVVHRGVQDPVKHQLSRLLLDLVLVRRAPSHLDHGRDDVDAILGTPLGLLFLAQPVAEGRVRGGRVVPDRGEFRDGLVRRHHFPVHLLHGSFRLAAHPEAGRGALRGR